jgi:sugar/nucleoside kinase (ribokinase family)
VLPLVDVVSPSIDDLRSAMRLELAELREAARMLLELGAAVAMVTAGPEGLQLCTAGAGRLGAAGALLAGREREWAGHEHFVAPPATEVRTTLAAGDAATAGLLYGLLDGRDPRGALDLAAQTAAVRVSGARSGDDDDG